MTGKGTSGVQRCTPPPQGLCTILVREGGKARVRAVLWRGEGERRAVNAVCDAGCLRRAAVVSGNPPHSSRAVNRSN
jgi:hypothetical protein